MDMLATLARTGLIHLERRGVRKQGAAQDNKVQCLFLISVHMKQMMP